MTFWPGGRPSLDDLLTDALPVLAVIAVLWFANVALTGWLAGRKHRDDGLWAVAALFLGPIALVAVMLAARKPPREPR